MFLLDHKRGGRVTRHGAIRSGGFITACCPAACAWVWLVPMDWITPHEILDLRKHLEKI
jgi:hypothetical protein